MIINEDFIENGQVPFEYWLMYFSSGSDPSEGGNALSSEM